MYVATRHAASVDVDWASWEPSAHIKWIVEDTYTDVHVESIVESLAEMGVAVLDAGRVVIVGA